MARILLVNDDPALLEGLSAMLRLRVPAAVIDTNTSPVEALQDLRSKGYDLLIADVKMPGMDGFTFVRVARNLCWGTPVVMLTGHGEAGLDERAKEAGACTLVHKPIDRDSFIQTVQQVLKTPRPNRSKGTST